MSRGRLPRLRGAAGLLGRRGNTLEPSRVLAEDEEEAAAAQRAVKAAVWARRLQRLMEPPGPPERTLTRQAMEQIRSLAREDPEAWPVTRLARGFQVPPDVIRRVLKSRFCPSPEYSAKQDARATVNAAARRPETFARDCGGGGEDQEEPSGRLPSPAELEALVAAGRWDSPLQVVRRGLDVFDSQGNFLYRIPETR